ncbi:MAG: hypothetical protein ACXAD7_09350 [Candidatus Kariarchaeaceae archaeon]|jgi:hypothetical protein
MTDIKIFNCQKSGSISELRNVKSTYTDNRTLLIQDSLNKKLWLLHGPAVDSEIKRLSSFSADELNDELNYPIEVVEGADFKDKCDYFLNIKDLGSLDTPSPQKQEIKKPKGDRETVKPVIQQKKTTTAPKKKVQQQPPEKSVQELRTTIPTAAKSQPAVKPQDKSVQQLRSTIPTTSTINLPEVADEIEILPVGDKVDTGPMVEDFQIAYYEASGGSNYILIEELDKAFKNSDDLESIVNHVSMINELVKKQTKKVQAKKLLSTSLDDLINTLFDD